MLVAPIGGGGGGELDAVTATSGDVLFGKTFVDSEGDPQAGTLSLSGNASDSCVLSGYTYYNTDAKTKRTGTMTVQSILSFSAAPYSSTQITCTWKNPSKGPFSGVIIVGKTGSYPTSITDGTRYYKGSGNNSSANGMSAQVISNLVPSTTYYFRAFSYATRNNSEWVHSSSYTANATTAKAVGSQTFTSSGTFTVPAGVSSIDIFCVGGGAPGSKAGSRYNNGGGGSGYTSTKKAYSVSAGQKFAVTVAAQSGTTSFGSVLSASGAAEPTTARNGGNGGSGGGPGLASSQSIICYGNNGGSNGSNGVSGSNGNAGSGAVGIGQKTTTRAFGDSSGTLYAGGGGGTSRQSSGGAGSFGGSGGGGNGAYANSDLSKGAGVSGSANTGGGGGAGITEVSSCPRGNGGTGICIVRWGY